MPYDFEIWKSENAKFAEEQGLLTAGQLASRLGVSISAVLACGQIAERHHVGGGYALVPYFSADQGDWSVNEMRSYDQAAANESGPFKATVKWLEWPAFKIGRYANNSKNRPAKRIEENCIVERISANIYKITLQNGSILKKRATTNGLEIIRSEVQNESCNA